MNDREQAVERRVIEMIKHWPGVPALVTYGADGVWEIVTPDKPSDTYLAELPILRKEMAKEATDDVLIRFG